MSALRASAALAASLFCAAGLWRWSQPPPDPGPAPSADPDRGRLVAAHLPLLLVPKARRTMFEGAGAGGTAALAGERFDVIVWDDQPDELDMRRLAGALAPGGLLTLRVRAESPEALRPMLRRTLRHFPEVSVWRAQSGEAVLLASRGGRRRAAGLDETFRRGALAEPLRKLGVSYPATLLSLQAAGERTARKLAWSEGEAAWRAVDDRATVEGRADLLLSRYLEERRKPLQPREYLEILLHPREAQELPVFRSLLEEWVRRYPRDPRALAFLYVVEEREGHAERAALLRVRLAMLRGRRVSRREIVLPNG